MILIIPVILNTLTVGSAAIAVAGSVGGIIGTNKAKIIGEKAQREHELAAHFLKHEYLRCEDIVEKYIQIKNKINSCTLKRFIALVGDTDKNLLDSKEYIKKLSNITVQQIKEYENTTSIVEKFIIGGCEGIAAGIAVKSGATTLANTIGVASTGTPISSLSGAAAKKATLAWLGGGSLATGGGGMELGGLVLGRITIASALAVMGFVVVGQGQEALNEAYKYKAKADAQTVILKESRELLQVVRKRTEYLHETAQALDKLVLLDFKKLESSKEDVKPPEPTTTMVEDLITLMNTPVLDNNSKPTPEIDQIIKKYNQGRYFKT